MLVRTKGHKESGFGSTKPLLIMLIIEILLAAAFFQATGFFGEAREAALEADLHTVGVVVRVYLIQSEEAPTANGKLPSTGKYAPIEFYASFARNGESLSFYPDFISKLPRHYDEGVWRVNSAGQVSVDIDPEEY